MNIDPSIILHEISNAGTIIQNGLDAEEWAAPNSPEARKARKITRTGLSRLLSTITTLRILNAHKTHETPAPGNLANIIQEIAQDQNLWGAHTQQILFEHDEVVERCEKTLVETAVRNFIANALRFSPHKTPIQVRLKHTKTETWISVLNHGPEIEPHVKDHIFRAGCKGTNGGSGLGLHIAQRCATALQGRVAVYSKNPVTVFSLIFPTQRVRVRQTIAA